MDDGGITEANQRAALGLSLVDPGGGQVCGGLAQMVFDLVDDVVDIAAPPDLPPEIGEIPVDQVGFGHGWTPFSTAAIASENSCHWLRSCTRAARPASVRRYVRRRRPDSSVHSLCVNPAFASRCSTG